jgi:glycosyltransferase involved in cell wall biosynthesis
MVKMNFTHPKISIIIPVYNGSNYLNAAIDSALSQTYTNIEILVINDGSNDGGQTRDVALSYGDKIIYLEKPNGGVASALNTGIKCMTGDYFSWLSHDDLYEKEKIEYQVNALLQLSHPKSIIYSNYSVFTTDPEMGIVIQMSGVSPELFRYWITVENCLHGCTLLIPKSAFQDCGLFNTELRTTQDYDMWFRISQTYKFIHIPQSLVKARSHIEQGSITMGPIVLKECNALLSGFVKELTKSEIQIGSESSLGLGYAKIASSMWYRGFFSAGRTAALYSMRYILRSPINEIIFAQAILLKGLILHYIVKPMRKIFSPYMRRSIKNGLKVLLQRFRPSSHPIGPEAVKDLDLKQKFSIVYENNIFNGRHSRSGEGSDLVQTAIIRKEIPRLIQEFNIETFLDAPCGDWYWMKHIDLGVGQYIGVDIVDALIENNQSVYGKQNIHFRCVDLACDQLPKVDLIFTRDCLVHLGFQDALKIIKNFKLSGAKYLLATTFTNRDSNHDLGDGFWRTLNLQLPPFNFPPPIRIINEGCTEGNNEYTDKSLGLWSLDDIVLSND